MILPSDVNPKDRNVATVIWVAILGGMCSLVVLTIVRAVHARNNPPIEYSVSRDSFALPDIVFCPLQWPGKPLDGMWVRYSVQGTYSLSDHYSGNENVPLDYDLAQGDQCILFHTSDFVPSANKNVALVDEFFVLLQLSFNDTIIDPPVNPVLGTRGTPHLKESYLILAARDTTTITKDGTIEYDNSGGQIYYIGYGEYSRQPSTNLDITKSIFKPLSGDKEEEFRLESQTSLLLDAPVQDAPFLQPDPDSEGESRSSYQCLGNFTAGTCLNVTNETPAVMLWVRVINDQVETLSEQDPTSGLVLIGTLGGYWTYALIGLALCFRREERRQYQLRWRQAASAVEAAYKLKERVNARVDISRRLLKSDAADAPGKGRLGGPAYFPEVSEEMSDTRRAHYTAESCWHIFTQQNMGDHEGLGAVSFAFKNLREELQEACASMGREDALVLISQWIKFCAENHEHFTVVTVFRRSSAGELSWFLEFTESISSVLLEGGSARCQTKVSETFRVTSQLPHELADRVRRAEGEVRPPFADELVDLRPSKFEVSLDEAV